ncbi:putative metal-dependent hydrolase of the TIM-barrel fold protein (plasmid) [Variovorax sp. SRS16]|uniref:amidohydrolase family protein n=1 Tax=Variovorax sp. SRS16 TaxID=282217 RepID=UPI001318E27C|nr:amidohydrolase family protein [Variovorax sp. SRS16]VTU45729.1 putative metal-dependent hydrolase of the TIM-barrel fold protein [Variovorax sp. SRS16]
MNTLPANACDCHMHVFDPKYPFAPGTRPVPPASVAQYREVQARLGTTRTVVVAPSSYGLDNRCTLDALKALGPQARAVVALSTEVTREELDGLHAAGVRGVRINLARGDATPFDTLGPLARRIEPLGWHVQLMLTPAQLALHRAELLELGVRLVIDHMARIPQDGGTASPAYSALRRLLDAGNTWVKLSLASSAQLIGTAQEDALHAVGRDLVRACADRLLWGSDWPHVLSTLEGQPQPSDEQLLALFLEWATTERDRQSILVDTPASLYDFPTLSP